MIKWYEKYPEEFREDFEHSLSIIELEGDKSFIYLKNLFLYHIKVFRYLLI